MISRSQFIKLLGTGVGLAAAGARSWANESAELTPGTPETLPVAETLPPKSTKAHFVYNGPGFGNRIALTYDDGPTPGITEKILDELAERNLKATFFMIGNKVRRYPDIAKAVVDAGHEVANHTYTHPSLNRLSDDRVIEELTQCQDVIGEVTGVTPVWFRPPYAAFANKRQGPMARNKHLGVAYWSVDPRDWANPGVNTIVRKVLGSTRSGSIILLHDLKRQTMQATPAILDGLMEKQFRLTTISGYLGDPYGSYSAV
ncbi:MAG: polysaccharide deacetylase family protein [Verrucomicrobiota bacterium]